MGFSAGTLDLYELYNIHSPARNIEPHYNLTPTRQALAVRSNPENGERTLGPLRAALGQDSQHQVEDDQRSS